MMKLLACIAVIMCVFQSVAFAADCDANKSSSDCLQASCSWCTSGAVGDSCVSNADAAALPAAVFDCTATAKGVPVKTENDVTLVHGDLDMVRSAAPFKKVEGVRLNATMTEPTAQGYVKDPLGYTTLYHSEVAYCGSDPMPSYLDRDYDTNPYTKTFKATRYVHSSNSGESVRGYVGYQENIKSIIISFRGSTDINNWVTDLDAIRTNYDKCDECGVHKGFLNAKNSVIDQVMDEVLNLDLMYPDWKIVVTGHSMGAALATLTGLDLADEYGADRVHLYNYGSPRIFNKNAADWASSGAINIGARRTHYKDMVVHVPLYSMGFVHITGEVYESGPSTNYQNFPGAPLLTCLGEEDAACADQWNMGSISDHLLYSGLTMGASGCATLTEG